MHGPDQESLFARRRLFEAAGIEGKRTFCRLGVFRGPRLQSRYERRLQLLCSLEFRRQAAASDCQAIVCRAGGVIDVVAWISSGRCGMSSRAKLLTRGRSQAVRLPKDYRFEGKEVRVSKIGNAVILSRWKGPGRCPGI